MSRISYVNGRYVPHHEAVVHIEDRGYQFSDAVYEGFEIYHGQVVDFERHIARLKRSMAELKITPPSAVAALKIIFRQLIRKNLIDYGFAYLQVSRGVAPRNHAFPATEVEPSLIVTVRCVRESDKQKMLDEGIAVVTTKDIRWPRVDIKTVSLLPNVLARQEAAEQGAGEAWFIADDGFITEGAASNAWIVDEDGNLRTRSLDGQILPGITRQVVLEVASSLDKEVIEKKFTLQEAHAASEAFNTGASSLVMPVVKIDGKKVGEGKLGPVVKALQAAFRAHTQI